VPHEREEGLRVAQVRGNLAQRARLRPTANHCCHRGSKAEKKFAMAQNPSNNGSRDSNASTSSIATQASENHRVGAGIAMMQGRTKETERALRALQTRVLQLEVSQVIVDTRNCSAAHFIFESAERRRTCVEKYSAGKISNGRSHSGTRPHERQGLQTN
jgi:hypothetical protein